MSRMNMYVLFVKNKGDVIGQIAYASYKKDKRDYIRRECAERGTELLPESLVNNFKQISSSPDSIERYKAQAKEISREFFREATNHKAYIRLTRSVSLWDGVRVIGSVIFTFIGYLLLNYSGVWDKIVKLLE